MRVCGGLSSFGSDLPRSNDARTKQGPAVAAAGKGKEGEKGKKGKEKDSVITRFLPGPPNVDCLRHTDIGRSTT